MKKMPALEVVTPKPPSTVELSTDGVTFNVVSPDGATMQSRRLNLSDLVEEGDSTALLMFGIMMQLAGVRQSIETAQQDVANINPMDPKAIEQHMSTMAPMVLGIMKKMGFVPPEVDMPDLGSDA